MFKLFWEKQVEHAIQIGISEPVLPRKRKAPKRFEVGSGEGVTPSSAENHYKVIYFEAIDTVIACIRGRFHQKGFQMYFKLEQLLINSDLDNLVINEVCTFYGTDLDRDLLLTQLHLFRTNYPIEENKSVYNVIKTVQGMSVAERVMFAEMIKLVCLIAVIPATNAVSERSFSAMRRIKTYLRSTMSQERLNHIMILHIHKELTDTLDLNYVGNEFRTKSDYRKAKFSTF